LPQRGVELTSRSCPCRRFCAAMVSRDGLEMAVCSPGDEELGAAGPVKRCTEGTPLPAFTACFRAGAPRSGRHREMVITAGCCMIAVSIVVTWPAARPWSAHIVAL